MQKQIDLDLAIKLHSSLNIAVDSSVAFSVQLNSERQSFLRPTRPHSFPKKFGTLVKISEYLGLEVSSPFQALVLRTCPSP